LVRGCRVNIINFKLNKKDFFFRSLIIFFFE
jgi:hypothetical protein